MFRAAVETSTVPNNSDSKYTKKKLTAPKGEKGKMDKSTAIGGDFKIFFSN